MFVHSITSNLRVLDSYRIPIPVWRSAKIYYKQYWLYLFAYVYDMLIYF